MGHLAYYHTRYQYQTSRSAHVLCSLLLFAFLPASAYIHTNEHPQQSTHITPHGLQQRSNGFRAPSPPQRTESDVPCSAPSIPAFASAFHLRTRSHTLTGGELSSCCGPSVRSPPTAALVPGQIAFSRSRNFDVAGWVWDRFRRVRNTLRSISRSSFRETSSSHDDEDSIRLQRTRGSGGGGGGGGGLKMLQRAQAQGVFVYLDRRMFAASSRASSLRDLLAATHASPAVDYIRAVAADGYDGTLRMHKGSGRGGKGVVTYNSGMGPIPQYGPKGAERLSLHSVGAEEEEEEQEGREGAIASFRYRFRVMYDGSGFNGWQLQPHQPSIQGLLETVISKKLQHPTQVVGAGRTDTGVHARGQAAHFDAPAPIPDCSQFQHSLNRLLPSDVKIFNLQAAREVVLYGEASEPKRWHAIYSSQGKVYSYRLYFGAVMDPLLRLSRHHEHRPVNLTRLRHAALELEGRHNFASLANSNDKGSAKTQPWRTVHKVEVVEEGGGHVVLHFHLESALYKMVRNMVGLLLQVACGKMEVKDVKGVLKSGERSMALKPAPAHGLCLERVLYDDFAFEEAREEAREEAPAQDQIQTEETPDLEPP